VTNLVAREVPEFSQLTKAEASNCPSQSPLLLFLAGSRHLKPDLLLLHSRMQHLPFSQLLFPLVLHLYAKNQLNLHQEISMLIDLDQEVLPQEMLNLQEPENNHQLGMQLLQTPLLPDPNLPQVALLISQQEVETLHHQDHLLQGRLL